MTAVAVFYLFYVYFIPVQYSRIVFYYRVLFRLNNSERLHSNSIQFSLVKMFIICSYTFEKSYTSNILIINKIIYSKNYIIFNFNVLHNNKRGRRRRRRRHRRGVVQGRCLITDLHSDPNESNDRLGCFKTLPQINRRRVPGYRTCRVHHCETIFLILLPFHTSFLPVNADQFI